MKFLVPVFIVAIIAISVLIAMLISKAAKGNYNKLEEERAISERWAKVAILREKALNQIEASVSTHLNPVHPVFIDFQNTKALLTKDERKVYHPNEA